jgi:hypothetical protein
MPNWCDNSLTISNSDKTKIDGLEKILADKDNQQVFQFLRPRPADQEENWYDWNINNWGTKWDASVHDWGRDDDNEIWISFDSAWSPPTTLYEFLLESGWDVSAYYHEGGMGYCGKFTTEDGDEYYEYDMSDRSSIEELPEDIENYAGLLDYHDECVANGDFDETEVG